MSDTVKIVIEIPKDIYERCKEYKLWSYDAETLEGAVATSKPLSENKGEWTKNDWNERICPFCGWIDSEADMLDTPSNFCPNCGADMRGE